MIDKKQFSHDIPTIVVVLGATGDLMKKKIIPSVCHLYVNKLLPSHFRVIGMARRPFSNEVFREDVSKSLLNYLPATDKNTAKEVSGFFSYSQGEFSDVKGFENLKKELEKIDLEWGVCTNKLFYLAVPPDSFAKIFENMAKVGLNIPCGGQFGWTRLLIEKPFGDNKASAIKLFALLHKYFKEEQLYLIDHYLEKEIILAIKNFRFSNNLFEKSWNKNSIERIDIRLLETIGVEERGAFFDAVGAFRDVGQNHLLQMLAAITMKVQRQFSVSELRQKRAELIETLKPWTSEDIKKNTFRAQYNGFKSIENVKKSSITETYFKLKTELTDSDWRGVPITLEAGKRCSEAVKEVVVTFKHPGLCVECAPGQLSQNKVVFRIEPEDKISIHFWTKKPGFETGLEERTFDFFLYEHVQKKQYVEEYSKIILNSLIGDQSGFVSEREALAEWKFTDPVIKAWQNNSVPLNFYKPDSGSMIALATSIGAQEKVQKIVKEMAIVGLGKMGANMARRMTEKGWRVVGYNNTPEATDLLKKEGIFPSYSIKEMVDKLPKRKIVWLLVPSGKPVDEVLFGKDGLVKHLKTGDVVIDGGNSYYKDTIIRAKKLQKYGIKFLDVGTSGGPGGALAGACLMIGGKKKDFALVEQLFKDFALDGGYQFFEGSGAGHFIKMIHNGIEYGMMQAIAEGFAIMKKSKFKPDLSRIADIYNHGSVVESRLIGWLKDAFEIYGQDLGRVSGSIQQLGEGAWTVKTAKEMKIKARVIEDALNFRYQSEKNPSYTGQIVSALRGQFGGHPVLKKKN